MNAVINEAISTSISVIPDCDPGLVRLTAQREIRARSFGDGRDGPSEGAMGKEVRILA